MEVSAVSCDDGHCRKVHQRCVGCDEKNSVWSPIGTGGLHTVIGRNSRRKGLEPSQRLSETTGPHPPGAFCVVFPATEATRRGARCKRAAAFFTHRAPAAESMLARVHPLPPRIATRRTCSRTVAAGRASAGVQGDSRPTHA